MGTCEKLCNICPVTTEHIIHVVQDACHTRFMYILLPQHIVIAFNTYPLWTIIWSSVLSSDGASIEYDYNSVRFRATYIYDGSARSTGTPTSLPVRNVLNLYYI